MAGLAQRPRSGLEAEGLEGKPSLHHLLSLVESPLELQILCGNVSPFLSTSCLGIENLPFDFALVHLRALCNADSRGEAVDSTGHCKGCFYFLLISCSVVCWLPWGLGWMNLGRSIPPTVCMVSFPCPGCFTSVLFLSLSTCVFLGRVSQWSPSVVLKYSLPDRCFTLYHWMCPWLGGYCHSSGGLHFLVSLQLESINLEGPCSCEDAGLAIQSLPDFQGQETCFLEVPSGSVTYLLAVKSVFVQNLCLRSYL